MQPASVCSEVCQSTSAASDESSVLFLVVVLQTRRTPDDVVDHKGDASWVAGVDRVETDEFTAPQDKIPAPVGEVFVRRRPLFVG